MSLSKYIRVSKYLTPSGEKSRRELSLYQPMAIKPNEVMQGFISEILEAMTLNGQVAILMLDQGTIGNGFVCLMVSLRFGERAIPVAWRVKKTEGEKGYDEQEPLLEATYKLIPEGIKVMLAADRFYGTAALISLCQRFGWQYRIRLQGNLNLFDQEGGIITPHDAHKLKLSGIERVQLGERGPWINVGILQESGHPEPWFIAMDVNHLLGVPWIMG